MRIWTVAELNGLPVGTRLRHPKLGCFVIKMSKTQEKYAEWDNNSLFPASFHGDDYPWDEPVEIEQERIVI